MKRKINVEIILAIILLISFLVFNTKTCMNISWMVLCILGILKCYKGYRMLTGKCKNCIENAVDLINIIKENEYIRNKGKINIHMGIAILVNFFIITIISLIPKINYLKFFMQILFLYLTIIIWFLININSSLYLKREKIISRKDKLPSRILIKLAIFLLLYIPLFICTSNALRLKNVYQYSDGFKQPYRVSIADPTVDIFDMAPKNFNMRWVIVNNSEINKITKVLKSLSVSSFPQNKGDELFNNPNVMYYLKFSTDSKAIYTQTPVIVNAFILQNNSIIIKINSKSKIFYFQGKLSNSDLNYIKSLHS